MDKNNNEVNKIDLEFLKKSDLFHLEKDLKIDFNPFTFQLHITISYKASIISFANADAAPAAYSCHSFVFEGLQ